MTVPDHRFLFGQDFALINPLQVDSGLWSDLPTVPLAQDTVAHQEHLVPRLLELRRLDDAVRVDLLERSRRHGRNSRHPYFSALLRTGASEWDVRAQLSRQLLTRAPDGSRALLRYYDPRVFRHLRWLLSDQQLRCLLGCVETWSWCAGSGEWQVQHRGERSLLSTLRLQPGQWEALQRLDLLHRALRQLGRLVPGFDDDDAVARRADALLATAYQEQGLTDPADRCLFAVQAIAIHPGIHSHPHLASRLARVRDGEISYVRACRDLDDPTLRSLVSELAPPSRMQA